MWSYKETEQKIKEHDELLANKTSKINNKLHFLKSMDTGDCTVIQLSN